MANIKVAGDLYESITGQLFEIGRQLRQSNGYPFDPMQLKAHLQAAVEGRFSQPAGTFRRDMRKEGWTLIENAPCSIPPADIIGLPFLKDGEDHIGGEEMLVRSRSLACYGQEDAEWLLDHQDQIPVELRQFYLVFPRTVWKYRGGDRFIPCLDWYGSEWFLYFSRLEGGFVRRDRLASPRR